MNETNVTGRGIRWAVGLTALFLLAGWLWQHHVRLAADPDLWIRGVLGLVFTGLILLRRKRTVAGGPRNLAILCAPAGLALAVAGLVLNISQCQWMGVLLLCGAAWRWALPPSHAADIRLALVVLYFVHPGPALVVEPLQRALQSWSVAGAEWLLHMFNRRVWADALTLHTGWRVFGVPEACSGLRTATTVLYCTLGTAILFRFRAWEFLVLAPLALLQVALINILRIGTIVGVSFAKAPGWGDTLIHDTMGAYLLLCILLVQAEATWWRRRSVRRRAQAAAIESGEAEEPEKATTLPRFWRNLRLAVPYLATAAVLAAVVAVAIIKHRPAHRAAMFAGACDALLAAGRPESEACINAAIRLAPDRREYRVTRARVLALNRRLRASLRAIDALPPPLSLAEQVMKARLLVLLGHLDAAGTLLEGLPEPTLTLPQVAITAAEYYAARDRVAEVARLAAHAGRSHLMTDRVRALFPYLARREQWRAIMESDHPGVPYDHPDACMIAVRACLECDDLQNAGRIVREGLEKWPKDARFLQSLYTLASRRPGSTWEDFYANLLTAQLHALDADRLATYLNYSLQLNRPDLAWQVYLRLAALDAHDPALLLAPARYHGVWLQFRRTFLGLPGAREGQLYALDAFVRGTRQLAPYASLWAVIPLLDAQVGGEESGRRQERLRACLAELDRRKDAGRLTERMDMTYPTVLSLRGEFDAAQAKLGELMTRYAGRRDEILLQKAALHDQRGEWQQAYEAVQEYRTTTARPSLPSSFIRVNAFMNLNLGVCAMEELRVARELYPNTPVLTATMAAIWEGFGFAEQALLLLEQAGLAEESPALPALLFAAQRFHEARHCAQVFKVRLPAEEPTQALVPWPAEDVLSGWLPEPPDAATRAQRVEQLAAVTAKSSSPFCASLARLERELLTAGPGAGLPARWTAAARDRIEQGGALYNLAVLLGRDGQRALGREAARGAVEAMPESGMAWRVLLALTPSNELPATVQAAWAACPDDPAVWLANLVMQDRAGGDEAALTALVQAASDGQTMSPYSLVRAGDYLMRQGRLTAAAAAAAGAIRRGRGLVPAYVLGLRCALRTRDFKTLQSCGLGGIEYAQDPAPFYRALALVRRGQAEDVTALEFLAKRYPDENMWTERLSRLYFSRGDSRRVLGLLGPLIDKDVRGVTMQSLLMAAEAARQEGRPDRVIEILEAAYRLYPDRLPVLNNLVMNLARDPAHVARARELLPALLELGANRYQVQDTAAMVYRATGEMPLAVEHVEKALQSLQEADYGAPEVRLNAAWIYLNSNRRKDARNQADYLRRVQRIPAVDREYRQLLDSLKREGL